MLKTRIMRDPECRSGDSFFFVLHQKFFRMLFGTMGATTSAFPNNDWGFCRGNGGGGYVCGGFCR